jgi:plasmid maintenance system antidote protein VapI
MDTFLLINKIKRYLKLLTKFWHNVQEQIDSIQVSTVAKDQIQTTLEKETFAMYSLMKKRINI